CEARTCRSMNCPLTPNAQVKPHRAAGWGRWQALSAAWPSPWNDVGLNALLGDWLDIIRKRSCRIPRAVGKVISNRAAPPSAIEMGVNVPKIYTQLRLAVLGV